MLDEISISTEDTDAIHTLPLSVIPLRSRTLKRARLVKNTRLESMVELFSSKESGSGQVSMSGLHKVLNFSGDRGDDLVVVKKLGGLASYDVYSLRIELRRLGIDVDNVDHLKLSAAMIAELSTYMQAFIRPLLVAIHGTDRDQPPDFRQIRKLFSDPDEAAARRRLFDIVRKMEIDLKRLPNVLEQYGDVYLSLAYYQHCLDEIQPVLDQIFRTLDDVRSNSQFASAELLLDSCEFVEDKLRTVTEDVTHILEMFRTRTSDMWEDISAAKFRANNKLVLDYQTKIGGALCALTVKADAWTKMFPSRDAGGIYRRANFVSNELKQGLESVNEIKYHDPDAMVA